MRTLLVLFALSQLPAATFLNPVLPVAPDPAIVYGDGRYFATWTLGDRIVLRAAPTLAGLAKADEVVVLRSSGTGPAAIDWWAPELHRLDGRWWLYWCATTADRDDARRRVFVSGCLGDDPLTGGWEEPRQMTLPIGGYAIDPTVFTVGERRYLAWSAKIPSETGSWQHICLAPMTAPDVVAMPAVVVCAPDQPWERHEQPTTEAPAAMVRDGMVHLVYSASAFWSDEYCLGLLTADADSDLLDPRSWRKQPQPLLVSSPDDSTYGPGHHAFFRSPDGGEDWLVFHARGTPGGQGYGPERRAALASPISWLDRLPVLGPLSRLRLPLAEPSGTRWPVAGSAAIELTTQHQAVVDAAVQAVEEAR